MLLFLFFSRAISLSLSLSFLSYNFRSTFSTVFASPNLIISNQSVVHVRT